jgi:hypothetical protein
MGRWNRRWARGDGFHGCLNADRQLEPVLFGERAGTDYVGNSKWSP